MSLTGKLGSQQSSLGNIMLGVASFTPVEPVDVFPILTLLPRDPMVPPRLRRFTDLQSDVHNSLVRTGQLVQVGISEWQLNVTGVAGVTSFNTRTGDVVFEVGDLPDSGVAAGTYSFGPFVIDQYGRVTSATAGVLSGIGAPTGGAAGWIFFDVTDPNNPQFYWRD